MPKYVKKNDSAILSYYTEENLKFDFLLTCPHSQVGKKFIENNYPEILKLVKLKKEDFYRYLKIECDFGTHQLAHKIAKKLKEKFNLNTLVIEPNFPRSVLDAGRLYPNCIRNIINYDEHSSLKERLTNLYNKYMEKLCHIVAIAKTYNAIGIDLHTMSTYSPNVVQYRYAEAIVETPETLNKYINLFLKSHLDGEKRETELFTGDHKNGIYANQKLLDNLSNEFKKQDIKIQYDKPYILAEHLVAHYLVSELGTVCIDLLKDFLSKKTTDDTDYDLSNLEIDENKLELMANIFANAVYQTKKSI